MGERCPTCGQEIAASPPERLRRSAKEALRAMRPNDDLYRGDNGRIYITHGRGEVPESVLRDMLSEGSIYPIGKGVWTRRPEPRDG